MRKLLIFLAGLTSGWFPPEAVSMLMEPPPGMGRAPRRTDSMPFLRHPTAPPARRRRHRAHRSPHDRAS